MTHTPDDRPDEATRELQEVLDALPVLVSYIDRDLRYVRINKTYEDWFHLPRETAEGRTMREILGETAFETLKPYVDQVLAGRRVSFESRIPYKSGARWIQGLYLPRVGATGEIIGFISLINDITQRREWEEAQRATLEQFRTLAALAPVGIFRTNTSGDCEYVNERWTQFAGLSLPQALGKGWIEALHPDDRDRVMGEWYRAAAKNEEFVSEYRFRTPQGGVTWLEGRASALRNPNGDVTGYLGTVTDITERRFTQERQRFLAESTAILASSIDYETTMQNIARMAVPHLADWSAVHILDSRGATRPMAIFSADPARQRMVIDLISRFPMSAVSSQGMALAMKTGQPAFYPEITEEFLRKAATNDDHLQALRALGLRSSISVPILVRGEVKGAISFATTTTSRRFGTDDLALAEELARRAAMAFDNAEHYRDAQEAVRAREEFLSIASHELKTPLTTLLLQLQGLRRSIRKEEGGDKPVPPEAVAGPVDLAMSKGQELADLITELLDISAMVAGKLRLDIIEGVDLAASARYVVDSFRDQVTRAGGTLLLEAPAPVLGAWDPIRMEQVLNNLVSNAVKYGGGKDVRVRVTGDESTATLTVRDQGIGIAPEDLQRIFKPFERAVRASQYTGWGLGLHIVRQIVEAHGGTIEVDSAPHQGAAFTVRIPRRRPAPPPSVAFAPPAL